MYTSIATVSLSGNLESKLRAIADAGFSGVEIFENDLLTANLSASEVRDRLSFLGLTCTMFQPFRDFEGMPDTLRARVRAYRAEIRRHAGARYRSAARLLERTPPAALNDRSRIVEDFRELGERAAAGACAGDMKLWRGAGTYPIIVTRGRSLVRSIIRPSG